MRPLVVLQILILVGVASLAVDKPRGWVIVADSGEDFVALVDLLNPRAPIRIPTRQHPQDVVVSPDGLLAFVAEMGTPTAPGNTVAVINVRSRTIVKRLSLGRATLPHLLALGHDGHTLWAACAPQNAIVELDTRSASISKIWDTQQKGSYLFAVTPDEKKLYVTNFDSGTVSVIRRSDASVQILSLGGQPIGIDIAPNGREVWISNFQNNTIAIVDVATDHIVQTFPAAGDGPARIKFTRDGRYAWVTNSRSNELIGFDVAHRRVVHRIPTGKFSKGLLILPDGNHALVAAVDDNQVVDADLSRGRVVNNMPTGKAPEGLAWVGSR